MNTLPSSLRSGSGSPLVIADALIACALALLALFAFWTTPEIAANLPQDAPDYAMPSVNLLERGRMVASAYGYDFPPIHPPGMPLLLLPAYALFGPFHGNGIYAILFCSLSTVALTYLVGTKLAGRWCGCFSALFLITNYGFWLFSRKIMSEIPSAFLGLAAMALALTVRERKRPGLTCLLTGGILGFAFTIRGDNALFLVPALLLVTWNAAGRDRLRNAGLCLAGLAPFLAGVAMFNLAVYGNPSRTGFHYWAATPLTMPTFSADYIRKAGFARLQRFSAAEAEFVDGNGVFYLKSLINQSDTTRVFGHPVFWGTPGRSRYQLLALLRAGLGITGLLACLVAWRTDAPRKYYFLWVVVSAVVFVSFYSVFFYQDERYLVRLVPVFSLADGLGMAALLARWPARGARAAVLLMTGLLIGGLEFSNKRIGFPARDRAKIYDTLHMVASRIESNAVVVSNFHPFLVDAYVIHGTHRIAVPIARDQAISVYVGGELTPTVFCPFVAVEEPERLREFLHAGVPVYWLVDSPWRNRQEPALVPLIGSFRMRVLVTALLNNGTEQPYFGRFEELPPQQ